MFTIHRILLSLALVAALAGLGRAQSNTQIVDTVKNADGSLFNGTVVITWTGGSASNGSTAVPYSTSARIYNGVLSVSVVPNASYSNVYVATYNSSDGHTSWVENWVVGISSSPLTLAQVRTALASNPPANSSTLNMAQISGLNAYLNALSGSLNTVSSSVGGFSNNFASLNNTVSSLNDRVNSLQASLSTPSASNEVLGETPAGLVNGLNAVFTIASTPVTASSVMLFRNGILQTAGVDYTLSGKTITFVTGSLPQVNDNLQASYRIGTTAQSAGFVDDETPQGTINGVNLSFTLANSALSGSVRLYRNGALLQNGIDFTCNGATITFLSTVSTPAAGDTFLAYYRTAN